MKPPFRKRAEPSRLNKTDFQAEYTRSFCRGWNRKDLLVVIHAIRQHQNFDEELDLTKTYSKMPHRSPQEIESLIKSTKTRVMQKVNIQVQSQRKAERRAKVPIEYWNELVQRVSRNTKKHISPAFSQILVVAATEPKGLMNSEPPHAVTQTPAFTQLCLNQAIKTGVSSVTNPKATSSAATLVQPLTNPDHSKSASQEGAVDKTPAVASATATPSSPEASGAPPVSSKKKNSAEPKEQALLLRPRMMKCMMNFDKIYQYLADMESKTCNAALTSMECAVLLEMLLCLPEELPLLHCKELQHHLLQSYSQLAKPPVTPAQRKAAQKASAKVRSTRKESGSESAEAQERLIENAICPLNPLLLPVALLQRKAPDLEKL